MCGILGGNIKHWDYRKGISSLHHRGPDHSRVNEKHGFVLAFARLSIIDLSDSAMQPMSSADGKVSILFNGEIYGYQKLRTDLLRKWKFFSESDTEVILNAYLEYGDRFIDYIDGMFAIAILDEREGTLKLFRDRAGIKPLYYYMEGNDFAFASELKAFYAAQKELRWDIDFTALYDYLFYGYIPEPKSLYKNCYKLMPAHKLVYDIGKRKLLNEAEYWDVKLNLGGRHRKKEKDSLEELKDLIHQSVKEQLVADVPVGTFLSGGIDSSIITYEANTLSPQIETFTIGFDERKYDETYYAQLLIERYKLNAKKKVLHNRDIVAVQEMLKLWYDEPFADTSAYPTYIVSRFAKNDVTVVLTGDGGDELFGGYTRYSLFVEQANKLKINSSFISKFTKVAGLQRVFRDLDIMQYIDSEFDCYLPFIFLSGLEEAEHFKKMWKIEDDYDPTWHLKRFYHKDLPPITRVCYLDFKTYLPGDILTKVDRVSMANSLECRVPFLSRKIIEFAFSLSDAERASANNLKKIMKDAYEKELSRELLYRIKKGFSIPPNYITTARTEKTPITILLLQRYWPELEKDV